MATPLRKLPVDFAETMQRHRKTAVFLKYITETAEMQKGGIAITKLFS